MLLAGVVASGLLPTPAVAGTFPGANGHLAFHVSRDTRQDSAAEFCGTTDCEDSRTFLLDPVTRRVRESELCIGLRECHDFTPQFDPSGDRLLVRRRALQDETLAPPALSVGPAFAAGPVTDIAPGVEQYAWAPDGKQIVVAASPNSLVPTRLYTVQVTTGLTTPITPQGRSQPDWGRKGILFTRARGRNPVRSDIYLLRPGSRRARRITKDGRSSSPRWSPDGKRIAFRRLRGKRADGITEIYVMQSSGKRKKRVPHAGSETPVWSPDGGWIAFLSGNSIYRVHPDGTNRERLYRLRKRHPNDYLGELSWGKR